jgi:glycosyltransferase involved in cell wall biosynthesis
VKVLLLGEFSALHKNLKEGLVELGHEVTIAASGDGWKKIPCDINLGVDGNTLLSKIKRRYKFFQFIRKLKGFDVVQIINADLLSLKLFPNKYALKLLKKNNEKVFLLAGGTDAFFWKHARKALKYGPFDDTLKYDLNNKKPIHDTKRHYHLNKHIADNVNGIIPIMYEYEQSYSGFSNMLNVIPIPINIDNTNFNSMKSESLVVFHGLNRPGFKGTHYIKEAFSRLEKLYPDVKFIIRGKMPLDEYTKLLAVTSIVIDQANSHSLGVNGLMAMAMGKIVLGGAELESLKCFNIKQSPVINILPSVDDIINKLTTIIDLKHEQRDVISHDSRKYICEHHNYIKIAEQYVDAWRSKS